MKRAGIFISIGMIGGILLALFLKAVEMLSGNRAYYLLFDVDYILLLNQLQPVFLVEYLFHFSTCIISIALLYYLLTFIQLEKSVTAYVVVIGVGSAILFLLTALSDKTPPVTDFAAWVYWVIGHLLFSLTAGVLVKKWV